MTRFFDMVKKDEIKIVDKDWKTFTLIADSLSIKVALSMFYSYIALNVNYFIKETEICNIDVLCVGYGAVLSGLIIETVKPHLNKFSFFKK